MVQGPRRSRMEQKMDLDLTGMVALVTGSTRGIGLASAKGLAGMGATVIVNGRTQAAVDEALGKLAEAVPGANARGHALDLGTAAGCAALIAAEPSADILVNNMGIYGPKPFFDLTDDDWTEMFEVNVMSGVRLTRHYLKGMLQRDWGRVVFISSESALFVPEEMMHYGFSKAAQIHIARGAAQLTRGSHVTVNSVMPGPTAVEMQDVRLGARASELGTTVEELKAQTFTVRRPTSILQRYITMDEVANMVCYVCSKASSATNGAALRVEGGIATGPF